MIEVGGFARPGRILVVGGANLDVKARLRGAPVTGTSNPAAMSLSPGGVGRNIAHALALLGEEVALVSAVGRDPPGDALVAACEAAGIDCGLVRRVEAPTGLYVAALDPGGELFLGVSGMDAVDALTPQVIGSLAGAIETAALIVADTNLPAPTLLALARTAAAARVPFAVDPVSVAKAARLRPLVAARLPVALTTPNRDEAAALAGTDRLGDEDLRSVARDLHASGVARLLVGLGPDGVLVSGADDPDGPALLRPPLAREAADVTGGGDAAFAAAIWALRRGAGLADAARAGQMAAQAAIASLQTVPDDLAERLGGDVGRPFTSPARPRTSP